jgi:hypothetical protein
MLTPRVTAIGSLPSAHPRGAPADRLAPAGIAEQVDRMRLVRQAGGRPLATR